VAQGGGLPQPVKSDYRLAAERLMAHVLSTGDGGLLVDLKTVMDEKPKDCG